MNQTSQSVNYEAVGRTALATPSLLITLDKLTLSKMTLNTFFTFSHFTDYCHITTISIFIEHSARVYKAKYTHRNIKN